MIDPWILDGIFHETEHSVGVCVYEVRERVAKLVCALENTYPGEDTESSALSSEFLSRG